MKRVEAVNYVIRRCQPTGRIRFHLSCGSWHGPHTTDLLVAGIVGVLLAVSAGAYSFGAANARYEHERKAWRR
jgi:5-methyltetrahydropteroyltriglutamate--homocysteine methyltransferase